MRSATDVPFFWFLDPGFLLFVAVVGAGWLVWTALRYARGWKERREDAAYMNAVDEANKRCQEILRNAYTEEESEKAFAAINKISEELRREFPNNHGGFMY